MQIFETWELVDRWVSRTVFSGLAKLGLPEILKGPSPITAGLPFINSPTPQILSAAAYLLVVLCGLIFLRQRGPGVPGSLSHSASCCAT